MNFCSIPVSRKLSFEAQICTSSGINRDGRGILRKEDRLFGAVMIIFVLRFAAELFV